MSTPDLFTITEAAVVLRIGRTTAYDLARRDLATGGGEGLGVIRVGGQLRVPRAALERLIGAPIETSAFFNQLFLARRRCDVILAMLRNLEPYRAPNTPAAETAPIAA